MADPAVQAEAPLPQLPVPRRARLELGHALGQRLADEAGVRVLHIKGIAAEAVLPIESELSADVDLLVEPAAHARFISLLQDLETTEVVDDASRSSEGHAVEIVSHGLGVSLDVHGHFPGFRAEPATVFDVLHRRSVVVPFAGFECACLDRVSLAVLGVVHAARNPATSRARQRALARWELLEPAEVTQARRLIDELRAGGAAASVIDASGRVPRRDVALFLAHQRKASPVTLWVLTVLATPGLRGRLSVVRRALSGRSSLVVSRAEPQPRAGARRQGRLTRGLRGLLPALREIIGLLQEGGRR